MRSGRLRFSADICQRDQSTQDDAGEPIELWPVELRRRFDFIDQRARQFVAQKQVTPEMTHLLRFRYIDIPESRLNGMRVNFNQDGTDRWMDIIAVTHVKERTRETQLMCKEIITSE